MKIIIEIPDGWKIGDCGICPMYHQFKCQAVLKHCALANAKEAVEVKAIKTGEGYITCGITGRAVTLYAVREKL